MGKTVGSTKHNKGSKPVGVRRHTRKLKNGRRIEVKPHGRSRIGTLEERGMRKHAMNYTRLLKALFKRLNKRDAADKVRQLDKMYEEKALPAFNRTVDKLGKKVFNVGVEGTRRDRLVEMLAKDVPGTSMIPSRLGKTVKERKDTIKGALPNFIKRQAIEPDIGLVTLTTALLPAPGTAFIGPLYANLKKSLTSKAITKLEKGIPPRKPKQLTDGKNLK